MSPSVRPSNWQVWLILTAGILSVSTAAIFIRMAFAAVDTPDVGFSLVLAASRLTLAALFLLPVWRNFRSTPFQANALLFSSIAGFFLAVHFASWITSLAYTSIAASATLVTTNPIWVALISWLWFREQPTRLTIGGILLTLLGGVFVASGGLDGSSMGSNPPLGNFLALLGSWSISLYFLLGREAQRRGLSISSHVALTYGVAAIVLLPLPLLFGTSYVGYPTQVYGWILLMAVFPQLIGHTSFNWAVRWMSPTLVTLTILAEPIGASVLGILVFQEIPGWQVGVGAAVILLGVAIAAIGARQPP
ncbi:DMT family transporter [Egbenema bharatensis]|uniref:DMT family transporter n=1 Tax=Egbenema bharatensis TaxID=3463334 RepID=UPI003A86F36F